MSDSLFPAFSFSAILVRLAERLWQTSWQAALVTLLVAAVCRLFPKLPPSFRCWLWRLALLKFLIGFLWASPILLPVLPASPAATVAADKAALPDTSNPSATSASERFPASARRAVSRVAATPQVRGVLVALAKGLLALWAIGVTISLVRLVRLGRTTRRWLSQNVMPLSPEDAELREDAVRLSRRLGLLNTPRLRQEPSISLPMVSGGILHPVIVLPSSERLRAFGEDQVRLMLAHEIAHVRRQDLLWGWLGTIASILFFFHPFAWLARREEDLTREMACDSLALEAAGAGVADYGNLLLRIATPLSRSASPAVIGVGMEDSLLALRKRLLALRDRSPLSRRVYRRLIALATVGGLLGLVPWRVVAQQSDAVPEETADVPSEVISSLAKAGEKAPESSDAVAEAALSHQLILPGTGIGQLRLGSHSATDLRPLGKPDYATYSKTGSDLTWVSPNNPQHTLHVHTVANVAAGGVTIDGIAVTSPWFHTSSGLAAGSTLEQIRQQVPQLRRVAESPRTTTDTVLYEVADTGMAFEFAQDAPIAPCIGVMVYAPGSKPVMMHSAHIPASK